MATNVSKFSASPKADVYQIVTDKFIEALKGGFIPWKRPWSGGIEGARSYESGQAYSLLNQWLIVAQAESFYTAENFPLMTEEEREQKIDKIAGGRFITFNNLQKIEGAKINKGCKSYIVTFYKTFQPIDPTTGKPAVTKTTDKEGNEIIKPKLLPMLRYYRVFSEFDCEGLPEEMPKEVEIIDPEKSAEDIISNYVGRANGGPELFRENLSNRAFYSPSKDEVHLPKMEQFSKKAEYYSTMFHELTHSTGHASRCNRPEVAGSVSYFGNEEYSREELVAEMGASLALHKLGISTESAFANSVAYIQSWLRALQNDKKMICWASARAERAVRWIFGEREKEEETKGKGAEETPTPAPVEEVKQAEETTPKAEQTNTDLLGDVIPVKDEKNKIIQLHITILKTEKIGGYIEEIAQQEWRYLAGTKLVSDIALADLVTESFAEEQKEHIISTTTNAIQSRLDAKYPNKYRVEIEYRVR